MQITVRPDDLNHVSDVMVKDASDLNASFDKLLEQLNVLKTIWQGQDADMFCKNVGNALNLFKGVPNSIDKLGVVVRKTTGSFVEGDEEFSNNLHKEVLEYEQPYSDNEFERI